MSIFDRIKQHIQTYFGQDSSSRKRSINQDEIFESSQAKYRRVEEDTTNFTDNFGITKQTIFTNNYRNRASYLLPTRPSTLNAISKTMNSNPATIDVDEFSDDENPSAIQRHLNAKSKDSWSKRFSLKPNKPSVNSNGTHNGTIPKERVVPIQLIGNQPSFSKYNKIPQLKPIISPATTSFSNRRSSNRKESSTVALGNGILSSNGKYSFSNNTTRPSTSGHSIVSMLKDPISFTKSHFSRNSIARIYDHNDRDNYNKFLMNLASNNKTRAEKSSYPSPRNITYIDLDAEDDCVDLTTDETLGQTKSNSSIRRSPLPTVPRVNSLLDFISQKDVCQSKFSNSINEGHDLTQSYINTQIQEVKKDEAKYTTQRLEQERILNEKLRDFVLADVIVLDEDEDESKELPQLTSQHIQVIKSAVCGSPDEVLISKFNLNITRLDIRTLVGSNWLNDEVINFYMNLLMDRSQHGDEYLDLPKVYAMNTFFLPRLLDGGHSAVRRWTRRVDIFAYDVIPVPVHVGNVHWCMAIIHFRDKRIRYYDSMGHPNQEVLNALEDYLKEESIDKKKQEFKWTGWSKEFVRDAPHQMNGSDCGVFSCMFAEYETRNHRIDFTQANMSYFRDKMVYEIVTGKLLT